MDRFIVRTINNLIAEKFDLKSNMDRFIETYPPSPMLKN